MRTRWTDEAVWIRPSFVVGRASFVFGVWCGVWRLVFGLIESSKQQCEVEAKSSCFTYCRAWRLGVAPAISTCPRDHHEHGLLSSLPLGLILLFLPSPS